MKASVPYLVFITSIFVALFSLSNSAYACDTCSGRNPNPDGSPSAPFCENGVLYTCHGCAAQDCNGSTTDQYCYVDPAKVQSNWEDCDFSCPPNDSGKFSVIEGSCSCDAKIPGTPILLTPSDNAVTPSQVDFDWEVLSDWGTNCFGANDDIFHHYEIFVATSQSDLLNRVGADLPTARLHKTSDGSEYLNFTVNSGVTYYWTVRGDNGATHGNIAPIRTFRLNTAPTARFSTPNILESAQPPYNQQNMFVGVPGTLAVQANDDTNALRSVRILARKFRQSGSTWVWDMPNWQLLGENASCSSSTCSVATNWEPVPGDGGMWWVIAQAVDQADEPSTPLGKCTGDPGDGNFIRNPRDYPASPYAAWSNCGNASRIRVVIADRVTVQGYLWDATGVSCSANPAVRAITPSDINEPNINVRITGVPQLPWTPSASDYNYSVPNVPHEDGVSRVITTTNFTPASLPNFRYNLACVEGNAASLVGSSASFQTTPDPLNIVNLGYKLVSTGWYTSVDGDVYGGYTDGSDITPSIQMGLPEASSIPTFDGYLIEGEGTVFANASLRVTDSNGADRYSSSGKAIELLHNTNTWPESYNYNPPANAVMLNDNNECIQAFNGVIDLDTDKVYVANASCVNAGINAAGGTYSVNSVDGGRIVVFYIVDVGTSTVVFNRDFVSDSDNRIVFISQAAIEIDESVRTSAPTPSSNLNIGAAILSRGGITFPGTSDALSDPDDSVVVEGPLVVGGTTGPTINFDRDRGADNVYPAEVVVYNPDYLYYLTEQEKKLCYSKLHRAYR